MGLTPQVFETADGARLRYVLRPGAGAGSGQLVAMAHSHSGGIATFAPLLQHWPGTALIWERRGYGGSTRGDYAAGQHDDLAALLNHLGADQVALLGLAAGGAACAGFAARWPDRTRALVLVSSFMVRPAGDWFAATGETPPAGPPDHMELASAFRASPRADAWRSLAAENLAQHAGEPPQPCAFDPQALAHLDHVTLATGALDRLFTPAMLAHAATLLPKAQRHLLPGVAHAAPYEDPAGFARFLTGALSRA